MFPSVVVSLGQFRGNMTRTLLLLLLGALILVTFPGSSYRTDGKSSFLLVKLDNSGGDILDYVKFLHSILESFE